MKKTLCIIIALLMTLSLSACGSKKQDSSSKEGFQPSLDTSASSHINIAGGYSNFEALEAEFDRFNEYYPNVELEFTKIDDYNKSIRSCYRLSSSSKEEDINSALELKIKDQYLSQQTSLIIISREYSDNLQKVVSMTKEQEKFTVICNKIVREEELTEEELDILSKIDLKETYDKCIDLDSKISTIQSNSKQLQDSIRLLQDSIDEINNKFNNSVVEFKRKHDEYQTKVREVDQHNKSIFEIKAKKEQNSNLLTKYIGQMTQIVSKKESYEKVQGIISSIESAIQNQETTIEGLNEKDTEFAVQLNTLATNRKQNEEMIDKALPYRAFSLLMRRSDHSVPLRTDPAQQIGTHL